MRITHFEIDNRGDTYFVSYNTEYTENMVDNKPMTKKELMKLLQDNLKDYTKL